jgi:hypothetical protein
MSTNSVKAQCWFENWIFKNFFLDNYQSQQTIVLNYLTWGLHIGKMKHEIAIFQKKKKLYSYFIFWFFLEFTKCDVIRVPRAVWGVFAFVNTFFGVVSSFFFFWNIAIFFNNGRKILKLHVIVSLYIQYQILTHI